MRLPTSRSRAVLRMTSLFSAVIMSSLSVLAADIAPEPVFDPKRQVMLFEDDFDRYTTLGDAVAGGWRTPTELSSSEASPTGSWLPSTAYVADAPGVSVADNVSANGRFYHCVTGGKSDASSGPSGTGQGIKDGTCVWDYIPNGDMSMFNDPGTGSGLHINPLGANQITTGKDGGKAIRCAYDGYGGRSGYNEVHAWRRFIADPLAAKPGHALYFQCDIRVTFADGAALDSDPAHNVRTKFIQLASSASGGNRAEFTNLSGQTAGRVLVPGSGQKISNFGFLGTGHGPSGSASTAWPQGSAYCGQMAHPYWYEGPIGAWHRFTCRYVTQSGTKGTTGPTPVLNWAPGTPANPARYTAGTVCIDSDTHTLVTCTKDYVQTSGSGGPLTTDSAYWSAGAPGATFGNRDGQAEMWYDGTLIVASGGKYIGVPIPDGAPSGYRKPPVFCENCDADAFPVDDNVPRITLASINGSKNVGSHIGWALDFDNVKCWRD